MGILAARSGDHDIAFYDDRVEPIPAIINADLVAFSVETFSARRAYQLADQFREQGCQIVMGGHHPTFLPEEALCHADSVVRGDAEGVWEELISDAARGTLQRIYEGNNKRDLSDYRIDRSIFRGKSYAPIEVVQHSRGCRFECDFCSIYSFYGSNVRTRPINDLRQEVEIINPKRLLFFVDDNLFGSMKSIDELLAMIKPLKLNWACQMSIDIAQDQKMLDRLAEAGCRYVLIGFESLDKRNLQLMNKGWNSSSGDYLRVVRALHQRGIGVYGTFVFGYDHDTSDAIQRSLDFALEAKLDIANFNPLTPTPGSKLYERLQREKRLLSPNWWLDPHYKYGDPIFVPNLISAEDLAELCFTAKKKFYAWSSISKRVMNKNKKKTLFNTAVTSLANIISRREIFRKQGLLLGK
jgi:radical SAM superfamily enzyme YgiQ (UPF0313 family)